MEELQEKTLQRKSVSIEIEQDRTPFSDLDAEVKLAIKCADEKKALGLTALDLRKIATFTEFFIIAGAGNQRQAQAIADEIDEQLKKQLKTRANRIEGYNSAEWILMDYGDFIVHIFEKDARDFYDLERLWLDAKRVEIPPEI